MADKKLTREDYKERENVLREQVKAIAENFKENPESLAELAAFKARFHNYSLNNTMLIYDQNPHAAFCGSFKKFKDMGYSVNRGEHGYKIFVPAVATYIKDESGAITQWSNASKELQQQAKVGQLETFKQTHFKVGTVFDISQTNCPIEDYPKIFDMGYSSEQHNAVFRGLTAYSERELGVPIFVDNVESIALRGKYGLLTDSITLSDKLQDTGLVSTGSHEVAHALMHSVEADRDKPSCQREIEADTYSIMTEASLGLETSDVRKSHLADSYKEYEVLRENDKELAPIEKVIENVARVYNEQQPLMKEYIDRAVAGESWPTVQEMIEHGGRWTMPDGQKMIPITHDEAYQILEQGEPIALLGEEGSITSSYSVNADKMVIVQRDVFLNCRNQEQLQASVIRENLEEMGREEGNPDMNGEKPVNEHRDFVREYGERMGGAFSEKFGNTLSDAMTPGLNKLDLDF